MYSREHQRKEKPENNCEENFALNEDHNGIFEFAGVVKNFISPIRHDDIDLIDLKPEYEILQQSSAQLEIDDAKFPPNGYFSHSNNSFIDPYQGNIMFDLRISDYPASQEHLTSVTDRKNKNYSLPASSNSENDDIRSFITKENVRDNIPVLLTNSKQENEQLDIKEFFGSPSSINAICTDFANDIFMPKLLDENPNIEMLQQQNSVQYFSSTCAVERERNVKVDGSSFDSLSYDPLKGTSTMHRQNSHEMPRGSEHCESFYFHQEIKLSKADPADTKNNKFDHTENPSYCRNNTENFAGTSFMNIEAQRNENCKLFQQKFSNERGKRFVQNTQLDMHSHIHTGKKNYIFNVCNKSFNLKYTFDQHYRIHVKEKLFNCNTCGKSFVEKSNLRRHSKIHTGEMPVICHVCNKRFRDQSNLRRHSFIHTRKRTFIFD